MNTILANCIDTDAARNLRDAPAPEGAALAASRSVLQDAMSKCSSSTNWSYMHYDLEAFINSNREAYMTKRYKSERKHDAVFDGRSVTSSMGSSSDSLLAKTAEVVVECKHCKKFNRTKPHPPKNTNRQMHVEPRVCWIQA